MKVVQEGSETNVLDLYAGPGGLGTGFSEYFHVADAVDHYHPACKTYHHNHQDTRVHELDVSTYVQSLIPRDYDGIVGVIGGPPCDEYSQLNRVPDLTSTRAKQILTMAKIITELRPQFALIENVTRVPREIKKKIEIILDRAGYNVVSRHVQASDYGSVQVRRRWILTACLKRHVYPAPSPTHRNAGSILSHEPSEITMTPEVAVHVKALPAGKWVALPGHVYKAYFVVDPKRLMPAVVNPTKLRYVRPDRSGYLCFSELIRAQGFPEGYRFHGNSTQVGRQIAQAVPVELARSFAKAFHEVMME